MSAKIQLNLEKRLPELRDLETRGVFDAQEIAEIVRRLTRHEGALVRQGTQAKDVIDYAEYEQKLEKLRRMRVKRLKLSSNPPTLSEYALPRHILSLYSRGTRRFANSKALWQHYISYTLEGQSAKAISAALTGAIAAQPQSPEFWIMAARWEADGSGQRDGGNVDGARKLIMRGLRFNRSDPSLWTEWLRIELGFAERMRSRWKILGVLQEESGSRPDERVDMEEMSDEEADTELKGLKEAVDERSAPLENDHAGRRALVEGDLVKIVLSNALAACSEDSLYRNSLEVLRSLPDSHPARTTLLAQVFEHLASQTLPSPAPRVLLATQPLQELPPSALAEQRVDATATSAAALQELIHRSPKDGSIREEAMRFLVERHAQEKQAELSAFLAGHIARHWRSALKHAMATPTLARLRLAQLRADSVAETHDAVREVLSILGKDEEERVVPRSLIELEQASAARSATFDDHLAVLHELVRIGRGHEVPVRLKRLQGRLEAGDARELEAQWSSR